jgi:NTE family protein
MAAHVEGASPREVGRPATATSRPYRAAGGLPVGPHLPGRSRRVPAPVPAPGEGMRRGLVLGGGGVLGSAWMIGAMQAYELATGVEMASFDLIVGTSAGAVLSALIGHGVEVETMVDQQLGVPLAGPPRLDYLTINATMPPPPRLRIGSRRLLAASARNPRSVTPLVALTAVLPRGRGRMEPIEELIEAAGARAGGPAWPRRPAVWIVAMDYGTGRRVVFGAPGTPRAPLARAVVASCAIPGWYEPVRIGDRLYVDGGARSATSLDLFAGEGLDEVLVLAPAASFTPDHPRHPAARIERRFRRAATRRLAREAEVVRAEGVGVTILTPGPEDLGVIGANLMDVGRIPRVLETSLHTSARALRPGSAARVGAPG